MNRNILISAFAVCVGAMISSSFVAWNIDGEFRAEREAEAYITAMVDTHYRQSVAPGAVVALRHP